MSTLMTLVSRPRETSVVVTQGRRCLLEGRLPPLRQLQNPRSVVALLEALSLWMDERLCVAVCAGDLETCFRLGLVDELGVGVRSVFYAVERVAPHRRSTRRRAVVVPAEGRQLKLVAQPGGGQ
jgi:hypothetical protein